jgi:prephenate dehydrogenase
VVLLCDLEDTGEKQYNLAIKFFKYINMLIIKTTSKSHDKHVSYISHLPHLISFALVNTVLDNEKSHNILNLAAGGFKDTSRLAKSDSKMWIDIFKQNSENMLDTIEEFEKNLSLLKDTIKNKDWDVLDKEIKKANKISDIL